VRGARGGLVRYSSMTGTSAMRTHVRNVHRAESEAIERSIAVEGAKEEREADVAGRSSQAMDNGGSSVPCPSVETVVGVQDQPSRKRSQSYKLNTSPQSSSSKKRREEAKNEILLAVQSLQSHVAEVSASLDSLRDRVQNLL
jgi:hypothetical protein